MAYKFTDRKKVLLVTIIAEVFSKINGNGVCVGQRRRNSKRPPSILFRSEFVILVRVPPVFFWEGKLKEGMKLSAFFSEWVAW